MPLGVPSSVNQGDLALSFAQLVRDDLACAGLVFNRERRIVACSPNIARLLGLEPNVLLGSTGAALPEQIRRLTEQTFQSRQPISQTEFFERAGQPKRNLRLIALPLHDGNGHETIAILAQDLSQAARLEDDIRQLDRLASVGSLAAEMAHEVKNALVAVKTFVDLLLEQNPGAELAGTVRREMQRIDAIVAQVLKYSRHAAPVRKRTSLHAVVERALKMTKPKFDGRNITIVSRLAAEPDTVQGDENHLEQAVLNLLLNANEAMNGDGTLTIETDVITSAGNGPDQFLSGKQLRLIVRDSGAGIPSEHISRLFEPFFTTKQNGTGLGLAITRRIIHEHHGLISAESEPGQGSAFRILLPLA
jgi:signal transduction histidine kinase